MSNFIIVGFLPNCDFCGEPAKVDGKTHSGPWANMCGDCFTIHGIGLGLGKGQTLLLKEDDPY
jgi:hypothetical protein